MTVLAELLATATAEAPLDVDWTADPWATAYPALRWLRLAPDGLDPRSTAALSSSDVDLLCRRMVARFVNPDGRLAWSSYLLATAFDAIEAVVGGAPEPLLRAVWELLGARPLDQVAYNFARSVGNEVVASHRHDAGWDLSWMRAPAEPGQVCLRYWTLAVRPALWSDALEREAQAIIAPFAR